MVPGDSWSEDGGFALQDHDYFTNRDEHLNAYRERVSGAMEKQRKKEAQIKVSLTMMRKFVAKLSQDCPSLLCRSLRGREVLVVARSERGDSAFAVDLHGGKVEQVPVENIGDYTMRIEFPALILVQSITMNMFGHAGISKRVHFHATQADMPLLKRFVSILEWKEAELIPVRNHLSGRTLRAVLPRWREGLLYSRVILERLRGRDFIEIEERLLAS